MRPEAPLPFVTSHTVAAPRTAPAEIDPAKSALVRMMNQIIVESGECSAAKQRRIAALGPQVAHAEDVTAWNDQRERIGLLAAWRQDGDHEAAREPAIGPIE